MERFRKPARYFLLLQLVVGLLLVSGMCLSAHAAPTDYEFTSGPFQGTINLDFMTPNGATTGLVGAFSFEHDTAGIFDDPADLIGQTRFFFDPPLSPNFVDVIAAEFFLTPNESLVIDFHGPQATGFIPGTYEAFFVQLSNDTASNAGTGFYTPVPTPSAFLLMGTGLLGLIGYRKLSNKNS